jgi:hypothetical protein
MHDTLFPDASRAGLYCLPPGSRAAAEQAAHRQHLGLLPADIGACRNLPEALIRLGSVLNFPDCYGANLDALFDCLTDPEWGTNCGQILLLGGCDRLQQKVPGDFARLLEVLGAAAEERRGSRQPLWVLIDAPVPGIAPLPDA